MSTCDIVRARAARDCVYMRAHVRTDEVRCGTGGRPDGRGQHVHQPQDDLHTPPFHILQLRLEQTRGGAAGPEDA